MNRALALLALAGMLAGTALAFLAPLPALVALAVAGFAAMRPRRGYALFLAVSLPLNVAIMAYVDREAGWLRGLEGGLRLGAALAVNLGVLTRLGAPRVLEGLRLPPRATGLLASVLLAAHDVGADFERLRLARRLEGGWPRGRLARACACAALLPPLLVAAHRRAQARRDALQVAGLRFPEWFVPLVTVAALSAAGRMALLALPNVALTYVIAFLGGALFGARVGALGAALGMALTDFLLTGLYPGGFVNAPAMALLGVLGGALRKVELDAATSAAIGIFATFLFSVASDTLTWLLVYGDVRAAWAPLVMMGLAFNVVPALVNGALFAAAVTPTVRAFRAWQRRAPRAATAPPERGDAPPAA